jgi:hypothetical protein
MESFFGGRSGGSVKIASIYESTDALIEDFKQGSACRVPYNEYGMVTPIVGNGTLRYDSAENAFNKQDYHYGDIYLRNLDGTATYAGNLTGPTGRDAIISMAGVHCVFGKRETLTVWTTPQIKEDGTRNPITSTITIPDTKSDVWDKDTGIDEIIKWLNSNLPYEVVVNTPSLRCGIFSVGPDTKPVNLGDNRSNYGAEETRHYFVFDHGESPYSSSGEDQNGNATPSGQSGPQWRYAGHFGIVSVQDVIAWVNDPIALTVNQQMLLDPDGLVLYSPIHKANAIEIAQMGITDKEGQAPTYTQGDWAKA